LNPGDSVAFGPYAYKLNSLEKTCLELLGNDDELSNCVLDTNRAEEKYDCEYKQKETDSLCPGGPQGCKTVDPEPEGDDTSGYKCSYICEEPELKCPEDKPYIKIAVSDGSTVSDKIVACFDEEITEWQIKIPDTNDTNQIEFTCAKDDCDFFTSSNDGVSVEFDPLTDPANPTITSTHTFADPTTPENFYSCENDMNEAGCNCIVDSTSTMIVCGASAFKTKCSSPESCRDEICYNGKPIMDRGFNDCSTEDNELNYCTRSEEVYFPCGSSYKHNCKPTGSSYECTCEDVPNDSCTALNGEFNAGSPTTCKIENIIAEEEITQCEKICFDENFENVPCTETIADKYWQCYDDFTIITIVPATATTNSHKAVIIDVEDIQFEDILKCGMLECPNGYCICKDEKYGKAEKHCKTSQEYYVSAVESEFYALPDRNNDEFEFTCLSFSSDFSAINDIKSEPEKKSECRQLLPPAVNENAECPTIGGCHIMAAHESNISLYGFGDCMCNEKCSYECSDTKYEAVFEEDVFPDDWSFEKDGNIYTPYTCIERQDNQDKTRQDNLVMIICTSIFVPLGVAGIAAGIYFFFFHESSEVAPVETDDEVASKNISEHDQTKEDKEETHSEIQRDN